MDHEKDIEKYEKEAERLKAGYLQCLGVVQYIKQQQQEDAKKEKKESK